MKRYISHTALAVVLLSLSHTALAAETKASNAEIQAVLKELKQQSADLSKQEKKLDAQRKELDKQQQELNAQRGKVEALQNKLSTITGEKIDVIPPQAAKPVAVQTHTAAADTETVDGEVGTDRKPLPKEKPPEIAAVIEEGGVLLPKGKLVITPSTEYSRSSATRVAIEGFSIIPALNIGSFEVTQIARNSFTQAVGARLGITNRIEIDAKVPYLMRSDDTRSRPIGVGSATETTNSIDGSGIGDIEAGAHYQINNGQGGWPFLVGNLRVKSATGTSPFEMPTDPATGLQTELPTGSGFFAIQPSITAIYPTDPAVFYSNIGYLHSFAKSFSGVGNIQPGDSISASFGMSLSLNDKSSFSVGYSHNAVFETERNGSTIPNSSMLQVGALDLGFSHTLTDKISLNLNVSAGITEDAPDSRITLRIPYSFDLF